LNQTLGLVRDYMKVEAGEIFLLEEDKTTLRLVLHSGEAPEAFRAHGIFHLGEGYPGTVAETRKPIVANHLASDANFLREAVVRAGFQKIAYIPLLSGENLLGVMSVAARAAAPFDERSVQLLLAVGTWAGLAIENARLHANVRRLAVLEERDRIGMDLHDGIIQSVYGVGLVLEGAQMMLNDDPEAAIERIQHAISGLNGAIRDIRTYILDLSPRHLGNEGLLNGIERLIAEYRANTFSKVNFTGLDPDLNDLPSAHALALFHICQEALANATRHAKAKNVEVALWTTQDRALMEIKDDGKGFDLDQMKTSIGHGLVNMRARAHAVGGEIDISSSIGDGATILVWVPRAIKQ
jgi:two-component system sensor histidine kinase DevS